MLFVGAYDVEARIRHTLAIDACFVESAAHPPAAPHAGAIAAECGFGAGDVVARIRFADALAASLLWRTSGEMAMIGTTGAVYAGLIGATENFGAGIHALTLLALFAVGTLDAIAGVDAQPIETDLGGWTLVVLTR